MGPAALLVEIGCEEIPARMIPAAASQLLDIVVAILDDAGLAHGGAEQWGGSRRLAVRVADVPGRQVDRRERVLGPPAAVAFDEKGGSTPAGRGFAAKQGIDPERLERIETDRGLYAGFERHVEGKPLEQVLADTLPARVAAMSFPKSMRWGDGKYRWVRPVHWLVALHGGDALKLNLFGIPAGRISRGHRFLAPSPVTVTAAERYEQELRSGHVLVSPSDRRRILQKALHDSAEARGGRLVVDESLLAETADLVEWPGVVPGRFDQRHLDLPREILVTTLRHHQKCFAVEDGSASLLPMFLAVANTDRDPSGHVRRGNEWVVGGRLEDARFFWREDLKVPLADRRAALQRVVFHASAGTYADKADRMVRIVKRVAAAAGLPPDAVNAASVAAHVCKNDLVTGVVGEFPELQGVCGGLLWTAQGGDEATGRAIYEHYLPASAEDPIPVSDAACCVSLADRLDTVASLIDAGEAPSGSRDPFGLRRAANGAFRIVLERCWPIAIRELHGAEPASGELLAFLRERLESFLRDRGATANEVRAVMQAVSGGDWSGWPLPSIAARLTAIGKVRDREDFRHLVELTKRVQNILDKNADLRRRAEAADLAGYRDAEPAVTVVVETTADGLERAGRLAESSDYDGIVDLLAAMVEPVDEFFEKALVIDPEDERSTFHRLDVLLRLETLLTRFFDIRELSGEAARGNQ